MARTNTDLYPDTRVRPSQRPSRHTGYSNRSIPTRRNRMQCLSTPIAITARKRLTLLVRTIDRIPDAAGQPDSQAAAARLLRLRLVRSVRRGIDDDVRRRASEVPARDKVATR